MTGPDCFDPGDRFDDCRPEMMPDLPDRDLIGKVVRVKGVRGRFTIHESDGQTVCCWGGTKGRERWRWFTLDRIGAVDREATRRREAMA